MRNNICYTVGLLLLIMWGCKNKTEITEKIDIEISLKWKEDSTGCLNYRRYILNNDLLNYNGFVGKDTGEVYNDLGAPNLIQRKNSLNLYYFISCCYMPKTKGIKASNDCNVLKTEVSTLVIKVDNNGVVTSVHTRII